MNAQTAQEAIRLVSIHEAATDQRLRAIENGQDRLEQAIERIEQRMWQALAAAAVSASTGLGVLISQTLTGG